MESRLTEKKLSERVDHHLPLAFGKLYCCSGAPARTTLRCGAITPAPPPIINKVQLQGPTSGLIYALVYVLRLGFSALQGLNGSCAVTLMSCYGARRKFHTQTGLLQTFYGVLCNGRSPTSLPLVKLRWSLGMIARCLSAVCVSFCLLTWPAQQSQHNIIAREFRKFQ